jgi:hypothetical protein
MQEVALNACSVSGRVIGRRQFAPGLIFLDVRKVDGEQFQVCAKSELVQPEQMERIAAFSLGDVLSVSGDGAGENRFGNPIINARSVGLIETWKHYHSNRFSIQPPTNIQGGASLLILQCNRDQAEALLEHLGKEFAVLANLPKATKDALLIIPVEEPLSELYELVGNLKTDEIVARKLRRMYFTTGRLLSLQQAVLHLCQAIKSAVGSTTANSLASLPPSSSLASLAVRVQAFPRSLEKHAVAALQEAEAPVALCSQGFTHIVCVCFVGTVSVLQQPLPPPATPDATSPPVPRHPPPPHSAHFTRGLRRPTYTS